MLQRGNFPLTTVGFGVFIWRFSRDAQVEQILKLIDDVKNRDFSGINGSVSAVLVVHGLCSESRAQEALQLLDDLRKRECKPDFIAYRIVAEAFREMGCVVDVVNALKKKRKLGVAPRANDVNGDCEKKKFSPPIAKIPASATGCAGLPLGIVTTASSMRGVTDIREWNIVLEQLKSSSDGHHEMEDEVFPILEWSFNRLRGCERPCFLYCCLYPEDHEIEREQLIDLFIFAELIPRRDTMELERSDGHRILNKLVKVCLLEEAKNWRGVECVRMHDLIRDMALRITRGRYNSNNTQGVPRFLVKSNIKKSNHLLVENEELKDDLVAVSLMPRPYDRFGGILEIARPFISPNCRNMSTLIINRADIREIPDSFLQNMCELKVLNLDGCKHFRALPNCISNMVNLTALLLDSCQGLELVPPLGKLKKLRILSLFETKVDNVPQGLEELVNLERLYMGGSRARAFPEGTFSKLCRLQHLVLPAAVHISDLQVLNELQLFSGGLTHDQFAKFRRWPTHYHICVFGSSDPFFAYAIDLMREIRSENKLNFRGCKFQKGLNGVLPPENLHWLQLHRCSGLSDVFFHCWIDRSKDLYHLRLYDLEELKFVLNLSSPKDDEGALRNLRVLEMRRLPNLVGLVNIERVSGGSLIPPGTFSSLEELHIAHCGLKKLFSVQLVQQCLQNLKHLEVSCCDELEAIVADNDDDDLNGGEEAIISQPYSSGPISSTSQQLLLPKLQELSLSGLPKLENVCSPTIMIGGDEPTTFKLHRCPKLKRLPSFSSTEITYEISGRKEWWNSLEWKNTSDKDAVQPFFKDEGPPKMAMEIIRMTMAQMKEIRRKELAQMENLTLTRKERKNLTLTQREKERENLTRIKE